MRCVLYSLLSALLQYCSNGNSSMVTSNTSTRSLVSRSLDWGWSICPIWENLYSTFTLLGKGGGGGQVGGDSFSTKLGVEIGLLLPLVYATVDASMHLHTI